ncbi:CoxG family protein [Sphingobium sp. EM0848]|uniref:CoxG family protein n=1 Tax=Sphingobium sp. EM0848 TaxID=2743473 RepID=UPI00159CC2E1|nr:carbon monoxide dehydrogenase subunit G [Sphingobium sp. EM0848]
MAFRMDGEFLVPASRREVWAGLNDPDVLCRCIDGCQELRKTGDNHFLAKVEIKIGPVAAVFDGKVELRDIDELNGYRIEGQGDGGAAGFAKGGVNVTLSDAEGGTLLHYDVNADIGGRLAQLGGRLINGVAKKQADLFFANFVVQFGERDGLDGKASAEAVEVDVLNTVPAAPQAVRAARPTPSDPVPVPWATMVALVLGVIAGFLLGRSNAGDLWVLAVVIFGIACLGVGLKIGRSALA